MNSTGIRCTGQADIFLMTRFDNKYFRNWENLKSQKISALSVLPLRAFLGFTFTFAGLQKLANPAFVSPNSPISIQSQFQAYARHSPIGSLISPLLHEAELVGVLIAIGELAVGIGTLLGFLSRLAASGGMAISLMLFLTVSYHATPYYTGSDIVFVFAWVPLVLGATGNLLSLDGYLAKYFHREKPKAANNEPGDQVIDRRQAIKTITWSIAGVSVLLAGAVATIGRIMSSGNPANSLSPTLPSLGPTKSPPPKVSANTSTTVNSPASGTTTSSPPVTNTTSPSTQPPAPSALPPGTPIGSAASLPPGRLASFTDPNTGDPAIAYHLQSGGFVAFDAVCPHAGCTVVALQSQGIYECPCHGSQFSLDNGALLQGPAATGLKPLGIAQGSDGNLYISN